MSFENFQECQVKLKNIVGYSSNAIKFIQEHSMVSIVLYVGPTLVTIL